ncbi:MAG: CRISPR-associated endonuclease Cas2 [Alphaproteobacteria bacterium]
MARDEMLTVFCYDVADDRARRRIAAVLEERAARVQRSVFEARLDARATRRLAERAARHLSAGDSLRVYAVGAAGRRRSLAFGPPPLAEDQDFWLL